MILPENGSEKINVTKVPRFSEYYSDLSESLRNKKLVKNERYLKKLNPFKALRYRGKELVHKHCLFQWQDKTVSVKHIYRQILWYLIE